MDMDKPETRMVAILAQYVVQPVRNQRAIPWCTTHDSQATYKMFATGELVSCEANSASCVISIGGPDHDWWVDV